MQLFKTIHREGPSYPCSVSDVYDFKGSAFYYGMAFLQAAHLKKLAHAPGRQEDYKVSIALSTLLIANKHSYFFATAGFLQEIEMLLKSFDIIAADTLDKTMEAHLKIASSDLRISFFALLFSSATKGEKDIELQNIWDSLNEAGKTVSTLRVPHLKALLVMKHSFAPHGQPLSEQELSDLLRISEAAQHNAVASRGAVAIPEISLPSARTKLGIDEYKRALALLPSDNNPAAAPSALVVVPAPLVLPAAADGEYQSVLAPQPQQGDSASSSTQDRKRSADSVEPEAKRKKQTKGAERFAGRVSLGDSVIEFINDRLEPYPINVLSKKDYETIAEQLNTDIGDELLYIVDWTDIKRLDRERGF